MSAYTLKQFSRPEVLASINPHCLLELLLPYRTFFTRRGVTLPTPDFAGVPTLDVAALSKVLVTPDADTPAALADALYFTHEMATLDGMDALIRVIGLERLKRSFLELTPADIAVRAWLEDREALERTHAELFATRPRRFEFFQTYDTEVPAFTPPTEEQLEPLERDLARVFQKRNRGPAARVFAYPHKHDCLFLVRHGEPYRREGTLQGVEPSSVLYRPIRFDVVVYDIRTATLRVYAHAKWETSLYRTEFGRHLFGSMNYFPDEGRYRLEPLRSDGAASLECADVPGIKFVKLTELRINRGGPYKEIETRQASDLFALLHKRNEQLPASGKLVRATFEIRFRTSKRRRPLVLEPPNVARYARDEDGPVIDRWLSNRGFLRRPLPEANDVPAHAILAGR